MRVMVGEGNGGGEFDHVVWRQKESIIRSSGGQVTYAVRWKNLVVATTTHIKREWKTVEFALAYRQQCANYSAVTQNMSKQWMENSKEDCILIVW